MLKAVRELGEYVIKDEGLEPLDILVEQGVGKPEVGKVICIVFERDGEKIIYKHSHIEDYELSKVGKYLYRDHPSHRFRITPTDKISTIEKSLERMLYWFKKFKKYEDVPLISLLEDEFSKNKENIEIDISEKYGTLEDNQKNNSILTIKISENGKEKYLGDFDIFKEILKEEGMNEFWSPEVPKKEGKCYLCGKEGEVCRPREPFSFYTVDKRGFASDLLSENSWKQLPACSDCVLFLVEGRNFLDKYLKNRFYGQQLFYYVIPSFIFGKVEEEIIEYIKFYEGKEYTKGLVEEEYDFLEKIKEEKEVFNLIFVFCKFKQGGKNFDILKYVEDVPPSWIRKLYDVFTDLTSTFGEKTLKKILGDKWTGDLRDNLKGSKKIDKIGNLVRTFFPTSKETGMYDKYFLDVIGDILAQRHIGKDLLINAFIREIRNRHAKQKEWEEKLLSTKSLYLLTFITELGLIKGGDKMSEQIGEERIDLEPRKEAVLIEDFFTQFEHAFNTADKKAVFLEGVLVRFLLDIQYRDRKTTPFRSKLHGLKLDEGKIKKLLPEITEKLREYKAGYYHWLEELISKYLLMADNNGWHLSKDEISYYFALGLNLGGIFKVKEKEEEGKRNG